MGIESKFIPIIFERFIQAHTKGTRAYRGLGLGLAIVRELVKMHEGTTKVESPGKGKGATFIVTLPVSPSAKKGITADAEVTLQGLKILVIDDEANLREFFNIMLELWGAEVKTAGSARQALALIEVFEPDILVSDIAMPDKDGYSLINNVRSLKSKFCNTPALALTAYAGREDVERTGLAGFQAHVTKPVDAKSLALTIAQLAGRK